MQNYTSTPDVADKLGLGFPLTKSAFTNTESHCQFLLVCNIRSSLCGAKYRPLSLGFYLISLIPVFCLFYPTNSILNGLFFPLLCQLQNYKPDRKLALKSCGTEHFLKLLILGERTPPSQCVEQNEGAGHLWDATYPWIMWPGMV